MYVFSLSIPSLFKGKTLQVLGHISPGCSQCFAEAACNSAERPDTIFAGNNVIAGTVKKPYQLVVPRGFYCIEQEFQHPVHPGYCK